MKKFLALAQILAAILLFLIAAATLVNLVFISMRPETISVVNVLIGQGVISICLVAFGRILWRNGTARLRLARQAADKAEPSA